MHRSPANGVRLRPASSGDAHRVWQWRYDPETRAASFDTSLVPYADHKKWYSTRLSDPSTRIYIIVDPKGTAVGYVRFTLEGDNAVISIALDPSARGRGIGTAAIVVGCDRILTESTVIRVVALVKSDNEPSKRAFIKAGFGPVAGITTGRGTEHRLEFPPT